MTDENRPPSFDELDARLRKARGREEKHYGKPGQGPRGGTNQGLGMAMRIGVEFVAGVFIGVGLGWLLDRWLGTAPWLMILFLILGAAAGVLNVYRAMNEMNKAAEAEERARQEKSEETDLK